MRTTNMLLLAGHAIMAAAILVAGLLLFSHADWVSPQPAPPVPAPAPVAPAVEVEVETDAGLIHVHIRRSGP